MPLRAIPCLFGLLSFLLVSPASAQRAYEFVLGGDGVTVEPSAAGPRVFRGAADGAFGSFEFVPEGELSLHVWSHEGRGGEPLLVCEGPCTVALEAGSLWLALGPPGGSAARTAAPLQLDRVPGGTLRGRYESRGDLRAAGWATLIGGVLGGIALLVTGSMLGISNEPASFAWAPVAMAGGVTLFVAGTVSGIYLAGLRDLAHVEL